jgi:N-acetylneuraminic acid mutarotase
MNLYVYSFLLYVSLDLCLIEELKAQNKMKKEIRIIAILLSLLFVFACNDDDSTVDLVGNWVRKSDFEGIPRKDAVAFTVSDRAFIGTGYDGEDRLNDIWEYDVVQDYWMQRASFPGTARNGAVAFGIDTKGYVGTGYDGENKLNDFWEYDPPSNTWTQIEDFGGSARYSSSSFSINGIGYVCGGYDDNYLKDLWAYDPSSGLWTQKVSIGGSKRIDAAAFVINGKAYVCTGINNGSYLTDLWSYDPSTNLWTNLRDISNTSDESYDDSYAIKRIRAVAFAVNNKGYIITGSDNSALATAWEYDPATDLWQQKTNFEGTSRTDAVAFVVNETGYVTTGGNSSYLFDDIWAFEPSNAYDDND